MGKTLNPTYNEETAPKNGGYNCFSSKTSQKSIDILNMIILVIINNLDTSFFKGESKSIDQ
jgi:hypothetical protein